MPLFYYIAKSKDGKTIKNIEDLSSKEELINRLKAEGYFIISIKEITERKDLQNLGFLHRRRISRIRGIDFVFLARNLATTLSAGVPLLRGLEIIASQTESAKLSKVLREIIKEIRRGHSLSEAMAKFPNVFSPLWLGIIETGEASGNLIFALEKLADYLELRLDFERKVKSILIYPSILLTVAFFVTVIFFKVILPKFASIFEQFNITLPLLTQIVLKISKFVSTHFLWIILGVIFLLFFIRWEAKTPSFRRILGITVLKIPLLNSMVQLIYLERFTSAAYILLESGVPVVYALEIVGKNMGNQILENIISQIKENVKRGKSLSSELVKFPIFSSLIAEIVRIGEESGNLPEMFKKLAIHYQKELSTKIERMVYMFEPIVVVIMGLVIGTIVISLFLPLFKISTLGGAGAVR